MSKTTNYGLVTLAWGAVFLFAKDAFAGVIGTHVEGGDNTSVLPGAPSQVTRWEDTVRDETHSLGLNPLFVLAIIWQESGGASGARGTAGEIGLMQVKPSTAADFGISESELYEPVLNIRAGARYLAYCFANTDSTFDALRAYNAGVYGASQSPENGKAYANAVLNRFSGTRGLDYSPR